VLKKFQYLASEKLDTADEATDSEPVFEPAPPLTLAAGVSASEVINIE